MQVKHIILFCVCFIFSSSSFAEYDVSELKNLFTDKSQRAVIDAKRSGKAGSRASIKSNQVNVSGYMTRSDGEGVVWLNNKNTLKSTKIDDIHVHKKSIGKDKKVTVNVDGKTVKIKPGESWYKKQK